MTDTPRGLRLDAAPFGMMAASLLPIDAAVQVAESAMNMLGPRPHPPADGVGPAPGPGSARGAESRDRLMDLDLWRGNAIALLMPTDYG